MEEGMSGLRFIYDYRANPESASGIYRFTFEIPKEKLEEALHPRVMNNIAPLAALGKVLEYWSTAWIREREKVRGEQGG